MTTTREARHLSGADLGKTVEYQVGESRIKGTLYGVNAHADLIDDTTYGDLWAGRESWALGQTSVTVSVLSGTESLEHNLPLDRPVSVTGADTPPGLNLHRPVIDQNE